MVVMEELEHALRRKARIYAEIVGAGMNTESFHPTRPDTNGEGIYSSMVAAIQHSGRPAADVDVIHAHGTATTEGDPSEAIAITRLFGSPSPPIFSVKSSLGHMMAGVGGIQSAVLIMALCHGKVPQILNLEQPLTLENSQLTFAQEALERPLKLGISNNAGFGGLNSSLLFAKYE